METVHIALAAHTMLYLPVYVLLEEKHRLPNVQVKIVVADVGDFGAYDQLGGKANLCICDPMTVVRDAAENMLRPTKGVVVGALVNKVGLWAVTTPDTTLPVPKGDTFANYLRSRHRYDMGNVLTYDKSSTAGRVISFLNDHGDWTCVRYEVPFGTELEYLQRPYGEKERVPINMIVTCDLLGVVAAEAASQEDNGPRRILDFPTFLGDTLFTGIVADRAYLKSKEGVVTEVLRGIQQVLNDFYNVRDSDETFASIVADDPNLHPTVGPGKDINCRGHQVVTHCLNAFRIIKKDEVLAHTVRLDDPAHREGWNSAFTIWWGLRALGRITADDAFARACDINVAAEADPSPDEIRQRKRVEDRERLKRKAIDTIFGPTGIGAIITLIATVLAFRAATPEEWWWIWFVISCASVVVGGWILAQRWFSRDH